MFGRVIQMMVTPWSRGRCCVPLLIDLTDTAWVLCLRPIMEPCLPVSYSRPNQSHSRPWCISMHLLNNTLPTLSVCFCSVEHSSSLFRPTKLMFYLILWWTQTWIIELLIYDNHVEYGSMSLLIYRMKPIYNFHLWMLMPLLSMKMRSSVLCIYLSYSKRLFLLVRSVV